MYEIFEKLLKGRGITAYRFCKDTGVSTSTISTWKKKNSKIDYLMTGKEDEQKGKDNTVDLKQKYRELEELLRSDSMKPVRYDGKPVNNDTIDLLLKQIEISLAMLKK